MRGYDHR